MSLEARLEAVEAKLDMVCEAIVACDGDGRKADFCKKWGDAVKEIEVDQKTLYGDNWNELDGIWDFVESNRGTEGFNEDAVVGGYINNVKEKFAKLKSTVEAAQEAVEDAAIPETEKAVAENHLEQAENAVKAAEAVIEGGDVTGVESALKEHPALNGRYSI